MSCCNTCYNLCYSIPDCLKTLSVANVNLTAGLEVVIKIKDKFEKIYKQTKTVDNNKFVVLDLEDTNWPAQLLNQYAGEFQLWIEKHDGTIIPFTVSGTDYDCIRMQVHEMLPKSQYNTHIIDVGQKYETSKSY